MRDYIDATSCAAVGKTCGTRKDGFQNLSLSNQKARLYGLDISGHKQLIKTSEIGSISLNGLLNYVNAKNTVTDSGLYNIMPLNARLSLTQKKEHWENTLEVQMVDANRSFGHSQRTAYRWLHLAESAAAIPGNSTRFDVGIDNALNRFYRLPLGGAYLGQGATMGAGVAHDTQVPGRGRSVYAGVSVRF